MSKRKYAVAAGDINLVIAAQRTPKGTGVEQGAKVVSDFLDQTKKRLLPLPCIRE